MEYLREFDTLAEYNAAKSSLSLPNVSFINENNGVAYEPIFVETKLVCKYNVTTTSTTTALWSGYEMNIFKSLEIDGVEQESVVTSYTFPTIGEHIVKFELANKFKLGNAAPIFIGVTALTEAIIPSCVTTISDYAFLRSKSLTSFVIPDTVITIGNQAFDQCSSLTSCTIGSGVTSIGNNAFNSCSGLTNITIPDSVTTIGNNAFNYCSSLTSCTIGSGVTGIGDNAFNSCSGLTSINIPDSVTTISGNAFSACYSLTTVTIGTGITTIGIATFNNDSSLVSVTIRKTTPPTLGNVVFDGNDSNRKIYVPSGSVDAYKAASGWSKYASAIEAIS